MNCILIDDEPRALDVLSVFIEKIPFISLMGKFRDPIQAMDFIVNKKPDLIFLDINMPDLSGLQLLKSLHNPPLVIFTTAYSEYAVESYELNAVDYLLKPIEFERFVKAVMKARHLFESKSLQKTSNEIPASSANSFYIKSGTKTFRIEVDDILYIEGMGNYVNFITKDKKITSYLSMSEALELLPAKDFQRIHKSFIVSIKQIETIEIHQVKIKDQIIPIGQTYRDEFFSKTIESGKMNK